MAANLGSWGVRSAQAAATDFRAAVCLFFFGGNDSNNMVMPLDATNWGNYMATRSVASNVGLTQASLQAITDSATGNPYGLHPNLVKLSSIYNGGKMAVITQAGTMLAPMSVAQYQAGTNRPQNLYSHSDQQVAWMGQLPDAIQRTGWGGRAADKLEPLNLAAQISSAVSVSGNQIFTVGDTTMPFVIPQNGIVSLSGQGTDPVSMARYNALKSLLAPGTGNTVVDSAAAVMADALQASEAANPFLNTTSTSINTAFADPAKPGQLLSSSIAQQFRQVARLIDARASLGLTRQFFFVSMGGFDTHSGLIANQGPLMQQIDDAVSAFYNYTVAAGVANQVTTFTASDFNRTFVGNANAGTDHAYAGHHFAVGGAVNGGRFYGTFPQLIVKGPDDVGSNGAWLPTTSVDQIGATVASWLGVSDSDMNYVFPNLSNFTTRNLHFV